MIELNNMKLSFPNFDIIIIIILLLLLSLSLSLSSLLLLLLLLLIGIHFIQGFTVTMRHGITKKRSTKRLKHAGNLFRRNLVFHNLSHILKHRLDIFFLFSIEQLLENFSQMFSNLFFFLDLFLPSYIYL